MSKYNSYARRLSDDFIEARSEWLAAKQAVADAQDALERCKPEHRGYFQADLQEAQTAFRKADVEIWDGFIRKRERLRTELAETLRQDSVADPDKIDLAALELMKSGTLTPDDYESFLERFDENPGMLRLVSKYSSEAAQGAQGDFRARLNRVAVEAASGNSAVLRAFDELIYVSKIDSGELHSDGYRSVAMLTRWEQVTGDFIDNF